MEKQRRALDKGLPPQKPPKKAAVVPVAALQQFLAALRAKDFEGAKVLAFQSALLHITCHVHARTVGEEVSLACAVLTDEPDNETVRRCLPEIDRQLQQQGIHCPPTPTHPPTSPPQTVSTPTQLPEIPRACYPRPLLCHRS